MRVNATSASSSTKHNETSHPVPVVVPSTAMQSLSWLMLPTAGPVVMSHRVGGGSWWLPRDWLSLIGIGVVEPNPLALGRCQAGEILPQQPGFLIINETWRVCAVPRAWQAVWL